MYRMCSICSHSKRHEIERKLLDIGLEHPEITIESIAKEFNVSANDLRVHAVMHAPLSIDGVSVQQSDGASVRDSIVAQTKVKESDYLKAVMDEYLITLQNMGKRINSRANTSDPNDFQFEKLLSRAVVDLYLGVGGEIRSCVKTLAEINSMLNGPKDGGFSGLEAVAMAIRNSAKDADAQ